MQPAGDIVDTSSTVYKVLVDYGVLGIVVLAAFYIIIRLYRDERTSRKESQLERDNLREERVQTRIQFQKDLSDQAVAYKKDLSEQAVAYEKRLAQEEIIYHKQLQAVQQLHYEERIKWQENYTQKLEAMSKEVITTMKSVEVAAGKALDRLAK